LSSLGKRNRRKGHDYERLWAKYYRDVGYDYCKTSRQASRLLDDSKVDLAFIPYNHQCKKSIGSINYFVLLNEIEESLKKNFPPDHEQLTYPIIISHSIAKDKDLVIMSSSSYLELIRKVYLYENLIKLKNKINQDE